MLTHRSGTGRRAQEQQDGSDDPAPTFTHVGRLVTRSAAGADPHNLMVP